MSDFTMPSLGADMDSGTLLEWLVKPGDQVHRGDVMAVVDTDKAAIEIESFQDGVLGSVLVEPGTRVAVGTPLATVLPAPPPGDRGPGRRDRGLPRPPRRSPPPLRTGRWLRRCGTTPPSWACRSTRWSAPVRTGR